MPGNAISCALREASALGTALSPEQQPGVQQERAKCSDVGLGAAPREPLLAGRGQADGQPAALGASPSLPKPHGAALVQADCLQKLVLVLEGLPDFKIIIAEHFWMQCLPVCVV